MVRSVVRRRWLVAIAAVVVAVGLAMLALYLALPRLLEVALQRGAGAAGFATATVQIARADATGVTARDLVLRMPGLAVELDQGSVAFSPRSLWRGEVREVAIDGLKVTVDFTQPRRGFWPEAVAELIDGFGGGGGELTWPVDRIALNACALTLVLPDGGAETIQVDATAERRTGGEVAFSLRSAHPGQQLQLAGNLNLDTLDGSLRVNRAELEPELLLGLARRLGLVALPEGFAIDAGPLRLAGETRIEAGTPVGLRARLQWPRATVRTAEAEAAIEAMQLDLNQAGAGALEGSLRARIAVHGRTATWSAGPTRLNLELVEGRVRAHLSPLAFSAGPVRGRAALDVEAGIPAMGGAAAASIVVQPDELNVPGFEIASAPIMLRGWTDGLMIGCPRLQFGGAIPVALDHLALAIDAPFGEAPRLRASLSVSSRPEWWRGLPDGWSMLEPAGETKLADLRLDGEMVNGVPSLSAVLTAAPERVRLTAGGRMVACRPSLEAIFVVGEGAVAASANLAADDFEGAGPIRPSGIEKMDMKLELPRTPWKALQALATDDAPERDLALDFTSRLSGAESRLESALQVRFHAARRTLSTVGSLGLAMPEMKLGGALARELEVKGELDTGDFGEAELRGWIEAGDRAALLRSIAERSRFDFEASASSVELPGVARAEWMDASLKKTPAAAGTTGLDAKLKVGAGILRAGPETIEQPAVEVVLGGTTDAATADIQVQAMLEGNPIHLESRQQLAIDWTHAEWSGQGDYALAPLSLLNSDILGRWTAAGAGTSLSAQLSARGKLHYAGSGEWDATADLQLDNGTLSKPEQGLRVEGITARVAFDSLADLHTPENQAAGFVHLAMNDFDVRNAQARFNLDGSHRLNVERIAAEVLGGKVSAGPFSLFLPNPDVAVVLDIEELDLAQLVEKLDLFNGSLTGRLQGTLPVGLLAGQPILGEGYLELDPRFPARLRYDAHGIFTGGATGGSFRERLNRIGLSLAEEGLADLTIEQMHVALFDREHPGTPIRIELSGKSVSPRAEIPMVITTNVNGSVAEALNFFLRMLMM